MRVCVAWLGHLLCFGEAFALLSRCQCCLSEPLDCCWCSGRMVVVLRVLLLLLLRMLMMMGCFWPFFCWEECSEAFRTDRACFRQKAGAGGICMPCVCVCGAELRRALKAGIGTPQTIVWAVDKRQCCMHAPAVALVLHVVDYCCSCCALTTFSLFDKSF